MQHGEVFTYTFTIHNRTGAVLNNITFNDVLDNGLLWNSEPQNITGLSINNTSISGTATANFTISNVPVGANNSFTIEALVPTTHCGVYLNQATLTDIPTAYGTSVLSDDPTTVDIADATAITINCSTGMENCSNGIDDDGDGLIDCDDPDCEANAISITPTTTADCLLDGSGAIELQINGGTTPYSYQWTDIAAPTAYWNFDNSTNDISEGNHHQHLSGSIGTPSYSTDAKEGTHLSLIHI